MQRLFDPLREEDPLPPSEVDVDRALRAGRRRVRVRWVGTGVVVVVVALLVPVLGLPGGPGPSVGPATRARSAVQPEDFDPMRRVVTLADVPGVVPESYRTARRWQRIGLRVGETGFGAVVVYAPGREATGVDGVLRPETGTPAEPVGGRPSYWVDRPRGELLAWQWTDGAWAFADLQDNRTGDQEDRDTARRIALAVRVGVGEPVTVPFTLPPPAPRRLVGTTTQLRPPDDPFVRTGLLFGTEDPTDENQDTDVVSVAVENGSRVAVQDGANQFVDGHPVRVDGGTAVIFGFTDGFVVEVQDAGDAWLAIARGVRLVPTPGDRSTWTSRPLG